MSSLSERLRQAMTEAGVSQADLARACGVKQPSVNGWLQRESRFLRGENLLRAAKALNVGELWLASGRGAMRPGASKSSEEVSDGPQLRGKVPLISFVQAGAFTDIVDNYAPGTADEWVETTVPIHRHTYALRVTSDSMTNPTGEEPTFPHGSKIIVEPDLVESIAMLVGKFIIVRSNGDTEATFKRLVKDGDQYYLQAINPRYPMKPLPSDAVICGVVREKLIRYA